MHEPLRLASLAQAKPTRREFLLTGLAVAASPSFVGAQAGDLATLTVKQASDLIRRRDVSALELTEACLRRIDAYNPSLNAFVTVAREQAIETARQLDAERLAARARSMSAAAASAVGLMVIIAFNAGPRWSYASIRLRCAWTTWTQVTRPAVTAP